mmetsp:Transcript_40774/g.107839  ORF Transcript_40774/g.107839 Transcript_40774/m.107839 type:complete len:362 (+) Transcript_40774:968-2053(+)
MELLAVLRAEDAWALRAPVPQARRLVVLANLAPGDPRIPRLDARHAALGQPVRQRLLRRVEEAVAARRAAAEAAAAWRHRAKWVAAHDLLRLPAARARLAHRRLGRLLLLRRRLLRLARARLAALLALLRVALLLLLAAAAAVVRSVVVLLLLLVRVALVVAVKDDALRAVARLPSATGRATHEREGHYTRRDECAMHNRDAHANFVCTQSPCAHKQLSSEQITEARRVAAHRGLLRQPPRHARRHRRRAAGCGPAARLLGGRLLRRHVAHERRDAEHLEHCLIVEDVGVALLLVLAQIAFRRRWRRRRKVGSRHESAALGLERAHAGGVLPLHPAAVQCLLQEVVEPHLDRRLGERHRRA